MESLRGVFPSSYPKPPRRNFIRENVQYIRNRSVSMSRLPSAAQSLPPPSRGHGRPRTKSTLRTSESTCNLCPQHTGKSTDSASQTMDLNDEYFLKDAIIRFPTLSAKERGPVVKMEEPHNEHATQTDSGPPEDQGGSAQYIDLTFGRDSSHTNEQIRGSLEEKLKDEKNVPRSKSHKIGEVPKYLVQRKKELAHAQAMIDEAPTGHYLLSEEERLEALHLAQGRYDHLINQLNALSITSQTFRTRNKRIEIEKELKALDNTLKIFSRNRVFVNLGE